MLFFLNKGIRLSTDQIILIKHFYDDTQKKFCVRETMKFVFIKFRCDAKEEKEGDDNEEKKKYFN